MSRWWIDGRPYTCRNKRFQTDLSNGEPHGVGNAAGSVFDEPLIESDGYSLWLEYVVDHKFGDKCFWLMWYDVNGEPTIPLSGIFNLDQLREMNSRLASFIQVP